MIPTSGSKPNTLELNIVELENLKNKKTARSCIGQQMDVSGAQSHTNEFE